MKRDGMIHHYQSLRHPVRCTGRRYNSPYRLVNLLSQCSFTFVFISVCQSTLNHLYIPDMYFHQDFHHIVDTGSSLTAIIGSSIFKVYLFVLYLQAPLPPAATAIISTGKNQVLYKQYEAPPPPSSSISVIGYSAACSPGNESQVPAGLDHAGSGPDVKYSLDSSTLYYPVPI